MPKPVGSSFKKVMLDGPELGQYLIVVQVQVSTLGILRNTRVVYDAIRHPST